MRPEAEGCAGLIHKSAGFLQGGPSLLLQHFQDVICPSIMGCWTGGVPKLRGKGTWAPSVLTTQALSLYPDSPATPVHTKAPLPSLLGH